MDLIFPHHEDEIAQSEAATGQPFVGTWLHCAHLQMSGEKMAKSAGNIARVAELLEGGVSARALRYTLISVHYRAPLNYSEESLRAAAAATERLDALHAALRAYREDGPDDATLGALLDEIRRGFEAGLDDDLNVSEALGAAVRGRARAQPADRRAVALDRRCRAGAGAHARARRRAGTGRRRGRSSTAIWRPCSMPGVAARAARNWAESDRLRDELAAHGVLVEDTRDGQRWRRQTEVVSG